MWILRSVVPVVLERPKCERRPWAGPTSSQRSKFLASRRRADRAPPLRGGAGEVGVAGEEAVEEQRAATISVRRTELPPDCRRLGQVAVVRLRRLRNSRPPDSRGRCRGSLAAAAPSWLFVKTSLSPATTASPTRAPLPRRPPSRVTRT